MRSRAAPGGSPALRAEEMYPTGEDGVASRIVRTASGLSVRVAEAGGAGVRPLLMLHGWGCSLYAFRHVIRPFAALGFNAIACDLKGHGLSDKPTDPREYTLASMTAHAMEIADALALDAFDVVGHSMGARIAAEMGLRWPERVRRLLLVNPVGFGAMPHITAAIPFARSGIVRLLPSPLPSRLVELPIAAVYGRKGTYTTRDIEEYRAPTQFREFMAASMHLLRRFDWQVLDSKVAEGILQRSWLVVGELDRVVRTARDGMTSKLLAQGWRVREVTGVAHVVHEETPEEVVAVARELRYAELQLNR